jgi:hypothetical protein
MWYYSIKLKLLGLTPFFLYVKQISFVNQFTRMKSSFSVILIFLFSGLAFGQVAEDELFDRQTKLNNRGMYVLGGWAVGNFAWGIPMMQMTRESNEVAYYFHQANVGWNVVNLGIAGGSLLFSHFRTPKQTDLDAAIALNRNTSRALLINGFIDIGYMGAGLALMHRGSNINDPQMEGWGQGLLLQGAFLFTFDFAFYYVQRRFRQNYLMNQQSRWDISPTRVVFRLD